VLKLSGFWWTKLTSNTGWPACVKVSRRRFFWSVILQTPSEVFVESFVVCVKKNLMITTNIDDDDANLLMKKKKNC
jgi:hypothetical protein